VKGDMTLEELIEYFKVNRKEKIRVSILPFLFRILA